MAVCESFANSLSRRVRVAGKQDNYTQVVCIMVLFSSGLLSWIFFAKKLCTESLGENGPNCFSIIIVINQLVPMERFI